MDIMDSLAQHISSRIEIDKENLDNVLSRFNVIEYSKKSHLLEDGRISKSVYFVSKGCLRTYVTDFQGLERNIFFHKEDYWAGDLQSFIHQRPSSYAIQAIEDSWVYQIHITDWKALTRESNAFLAYSRLLFRNNIVQLQNRITQYLSLSAKQRYNYFLENFPELNQRVAQKHIASYLGITPEFLSLLRKKNSSKS